MPRLCTGPVSVRDPVPSSTAGLLRTCVSLGPPADLTGVRKEGSNRGVRRQRPPKLHPLPQAPAGGWFRPRPPAKGSARTAPQRDVPFCQWQNHPARSYESFARSTTFARIVSIGAHCTVSHAVNTARIGIELRNASVCGVSTNARKPMAFACAATNSVRKRRTYAVWIVRHTTQHTRRRNERT